MDLIQRAEESKQDAYLRGREEGIDKAIECAMWYLYAAHIEVDQRDMEKYIRKMVEHDLFEEHK